jgi:transposase
MLRVEERFMIKEWYRQGLSVSEMARRSGHDRKTVRKVIHGPLEVKPRRPLRPRKIDPYVAYVESRMAVGVYNAHKLFEEIRAQGYTGGKTQVRLYVQHRRPPKSSGQATVRFETEPGQQAQVDWGSFGSAEWEGKQQRLYAFLMTLGWSRAVYLEFTTSLDTGWFLRCHQHAFEYFGGIPREVLHDNLKSAVLSRDGAGNIHWNPRYLDFALAHGFQPRACQPYRAQTKGTVENGMRYVRGNFWPGIHFSGLADLNQQALNWCNTVANPRLHATTGEVPFRRLALEKLQPLPGVRYDTSIVTMRQVSRDCLVSYEGNYYSVPAAYTRQTVLVKETETREVLVLNGLGELVAHHRLLSGRRQRSVVEAHYAPLRPPPTDPPRTPGLPLLLICAAPQVEIRPLSVYAALVEEVGHE